MPKFRALSAFILLSLVSCASIPVLHPGRATGTMLASAEVVVQVVQTDSGMGTGVVVGKDGLVLTNHHVIAVTCKRVPVDPDAKEVSGGPAIETKEVCTSGRYQVCVVRDGYQSCAPAKLLASDESHDLALLRSERSYPKAAVFGDDEKLEPVETVYAWVNVGVLLPPTLFRGQFANHADPRYAPVPFRMLIVDLPINHGASGGPLFDMRGRLIGIVFGFTRIANDASGTDNGSPLGMGVPVKAIVAFLETTGVWKRP